MSLQHGSYLPPVDTPSVVVPFHRTQNIGYFGEPGVYYDERGLQDEINAIKVKSGTSKSKNKLKNTPPSLRLLWLLVSSMMAVKEGNCQLCPTHNGLYPNVSNCKCYYKCIDGVPIPKFCPPGKKFDVMSMSCTFPSSTVCAGSLLQVLPSTMTKQQATDMMQLLQQMKHQQMMQQMQQQQMMQQQTQQQQMPQMQMQGANGGKYHITLAVAKPNNQGGGGGGNNQMQGGGNGGGGNGGGGDMQGGMMQMMQMMQMLMMMMNMPMKGMMNQNMMGQNMMNQNMMGQNMMNQNMMNQNMMGQSMMGQNMMGQNMMNQNMMSQNMGQQNMGQQNMGQQNMGQQNMNQNMQQQGGGNGNQQQCVSCNRPRINVDYSFNFGKLLPIRLRLMGAQRLFGLRMMTLPLASILPMAAAAIPLMNPGMLRALTRFALF